MSDQNALAVGDRVKVKDQDITGEIVWIDSEKSSYASVLDDDRSDWMDSEDDGTLEFRISDLMKEGLNA
jgi:hypothetical protein